MKILIVDDHSTNRKLTRIILETEGHSTCEAADGVEALALLEKEPVDAVISDILMPNMDGFRLCQEIRKSQRLAKLPIIIYTATYTSPEDVILANSIGADKYLTKPVAASTLLQSLNDVVAKAKGRSADTSAAPAKELDVMKQYSQALVHKLEEKNAELHKSLKELQEAHQRIVELNNDLERRVTERTAELEMANRELTQSLSEVKELRGILPICCYCKNVRNDRNYWQSVEGYISQHTDAKFSHGFCPECYEKHVKPQLEQFDSGMIEKS